MSESASFVNQILDFVSKVSTNNIDNSNIMYELINALHELSCSASKVVMILQNFGKQKNSTHYSSTYDSSRKMSYASAVKEPVNTNYPQKNLGVTEFDLKHNNPLNKPNNRQSKISSNKTIPPNNNDAFKNELVKLKNLRNDAYLKHQRNNMISNVYENSLYKPGPKIPKKFAPNFTRYDSNEIRNHKIEVSINRVREEIKTMRLHEQIQINRCVMYDNKVKEHINTINDSSRREKLLAGYLSIINKYGEFCNKMLNTKREFFESNKHLVLVERYPKSVANLSNPYADEESDPDDVSSVTDQPAGEQCKDQSIEISTGTKRKADNDICTSQPSLNDEIVIHSQPNRACKLQNPTSALSKNLLVTGKRARTRSLTQL